MPAAIDIITTPTSCFASRIAAIRYFEGQGEPDPWSAVVTRLASGEITIGEPVQTRDVIDMSLDPDGRWSVTCLRSQ